MSYPLQTFFIVLPYLLGFGFIIYIQYKKGYRDIANEACNTYLFKVLEEKGYKFVSIVVLTKWMDITRDRGDFAAFKQLPWERGGSGIDIYCYLHYLDLNKEMKRTTVKIPIGPQAWMRRIEIFPEL